jgi:L-ascorbate metabolism protein UlaG (beta-lactamase superfamily)
MHLTWLDSNTWLIELAGQRILLDPWLVGELIFGNQKWLFQGTRSRDRAIPENLDLILLSQGLEDHAHPETLKHLDKSIPVVGSPAAAKVAQVLGFHQVTALPHGETWTHEQLKITAIPGSPIGPVARENGYLIQALDTGITLYYEPHGYHDDSLKDFAPIDVVITPLIDLALPVVGSVIRGRQSALDLAQLVKPQVIIPTAAGGDIEFNGLLMKVLKAVGNTNEFRAKLAQRRLMTRVVEPKPGDRIPISVKPTATIR